MARGGILEDKGIPPAKSVQAGAVALTILGTIVYIGHVINVEREPRIHAFSKLASVPHF